MGARARRPYTPSRHIVLQIGTAATEQGTAMRQDWADHPRESRSVAIARLARRARHAAAAEMSGFSAARAPA